MGFYKENAFWCSPFNDQAEVREAAVPHHAVTIHDATLRDGEQTAGVVFSEDDKVRIADKLVEVGVTRIEAGMPAVSESDFNATVRIARAHPEAEIYAFARAMKKDIDLAVDSGCRGVVIEAPIGYPKLKYQFGWTWEDVAKKSIDTIRYAKEKGLKVDYFPYDATRANESDLENLFQALKENDAIPDSVGLVDTMGCALPQTIAYMVKWYKRMLNNIVVEVHTHNDFGMAVATELAGVSAGAEVIHSCVNGLGERTGNAALEELILSLNLLMGMNTPYKTDHLYELCKMVEEISGVRLAQNKPFVGDRNYVRESGLGVDLVIREPLAMFATNPKYFGRKAEVVLGKKSGKLSVEYHLEKLGLSAAPEQVTELVGLVKEKGAKKKALLTEKEFEEIVHQVL